MEIRAHKEKKEKTNQKTIEGWRRVIKGDKE